jgi:G3E family GTPase
MTPPQERPPTPLPLTVVIGFLGAGKTSLLNALLRDPAHAGTLVIFNEFGEIGLDHLLVERTTTCWCRIRAFCMPHAAPLAPAAFDLFLELLRKAHGPRLLRVKGIGGARRRSLAASRHPGRPARVSPAPAASGLA